MDGIRCARGIKSANYSITLVVVAGRIGRRQPNCFLSTTAANDL